MSGFAFPEVLVNVYERFAAGRTEDAFALFDAYLPLIRYEQQLGIGLAIRKEILHRRGVLASPMVRPPAPASTRRTEPSSRACSRASSAASRTVSESSARRARRGTSAAGWQCAGSAHRRARALWRLGVSPACSEAQPPMSALWGEPGLYALAWTRAPREDARAGAASVLDATTSNGAPDTLVTGRMPWSVKISSIISCMLSWIRCVCSSLMRMPRRRDIATFS